MSEINRIEGIRKDYWMIFYVLGLVFMFPLQQMITLGACLYFPWGYVIWLPILKAGGYLLDLLKISHNLQEILLIILLFSLFILFTVIYTKSLLWLNTKQAKKYSWRLPYLTLGYHFSGAIVACLEWYVFINSKEVPDGGDILDMIHLVLYALILITVMLFIFLDWRQAKKLVSLIEREKAKTIEGRDISEKGF